MTDRVPTTLFSEQEDGSAIGYMCLTDFEYEVGGASGGNRVFPSIDDLKRCKPCVESCGIAEVRITGVSVIQEAKDYDIDEE